MHWQLPKASMSSAGMLVAMNNVGRIAARSSLSLLETLHKISMHVSFWLGSDDGNKVKNLIPCIDFLCAFAPSPLQHNARRPESARSLGAAHGRSYLSRRRRRELRVAGALCLRLREGVMAFDYIVGGVGGALMLGYLVIALLRSEKF